MRTATNDPQRTCILSGRTANRADLIRLALSPGGEVLPDPAAKAPGRGAWIGVTAGALREAQASGKLKGALGRAFKGDARAVPEDLAARICEDLERRALDRIGIEKRTGAVLFGFDRVMAAIRTGEARLVLHADDAGTDGREKLDRAVRSAALQSEGAEAKSVTLPVGRDRLSAAVGQANAVHAAFIDADAAMRMQAALSRWMGFCQPDATDRFMNGRDRNEADARDAARSEMRM